MNKPGNANLQNSSFGIEGVAGLNLVEASPHVQQHMPEVVHVPPPLVRKPSPDVQLPRVWADQWVKHWGLKNNRLGKREERMRTFNYIILKLLAVDGKTQKAYWNTDCKNFGSS